MMNGEVVVSMFNVGNAAGFFLIQKKKTNSKVPRVGAITIKSLEVFLGDQLASIYSWLNGA